MTSRELVKAALAHQSTDRVPQLIDIPRDTWAQLAPHVQADSAEAFCDNDVLDVCPPWWSFEYDNRPADWLDLDPPTTQLPAREIGCWREFGDRLKAIRDAGVEKYLLVRLYGIHFEQGHFARGFGNFIADMATAPAFSHRFLRECVDRNLRYMEPFLAAGEIDGVLLGSDWGGQRGLLMSMEMFNDFLRVGEQRMIDAAHAAGKDVWLHSCGDIAELLPTIIDMGYDVLNPLQPECLDIASIKIRFGQDLCLWGGINTQTILSFGTPDDVRAEARRVRDLLSIGGGYIFGPSQDLQPDVPLENILALLDVAREPAVCS